MVSYAQSGGADHSAVANVTIDTPSIIFSLDPLFALLDFVSTPSKEAAARTAGTEPSTPESEGAPVVSEEADKVEQPSQGTLAYRVNVVQASVKLLADPSRHDSEAIVLSIRQVQLAQQGTMVLSVDHMGIFLCKMDKQKETIRILDDFHLNLSMDNRQDNGNQVSNIELDMQALVVRLSNRDVFLVSSIVSRAIELSASPEEEENKKKQEKASQKPQRPVKAKQSSQALTASTRNGRRPSGARPPKAEVIVTRETVSTIVHASNSAQFCSLAPSFVRRSALGPYQRSPRVASPRLQGPTLHCTCRRLVCRRAYQPHHVVLERRADEEALPDASGCQHHACHQLLQPHQFSLGSSDGPLGVQCTSYKDCRDTSYGSHAGFEEALGGQRHAYLYRACLEFDVSVE